MKNFRPGFLQRGYPLGQLTKTIRLTTDTPEVDLTGYTALSVYSQVGIQNSCTASGAGPYTITVNSPSHGLETPDDIHVYNAAGWTTPANAETTAAPVTVIDADTFTYEVLADPGTSGTIDWAPYSSARNLTLLDGNLEGQQVFIYLQNTVAPTFTPSGAEGLLLLQAPALPSDSNLALSSDFIAITANSCITMVWKNQKWVEVSRTIVSP